MLIRALDEHSQQLSAALRRSRVRSSEFSALMMMTKFSACAGGADRFLRSSLRNTVRSMQGLLCGNRAQNLHRRALPATALVKGALLDRVYGVCDHFGVLLLGERCLVCGRGPAGGC